MSHNLINPKTSSSKVSEGPSPSCSTFTPIPQNAPGASAAVGHTVENSIPLSIFPIGMIPFPYVDVLDFDSHLHMF